MKLLLQDPGRETTYYAHHCVAAHLSRWYGAGKEVEIN